MSQNKDNVIPLKKPVQIIEPETIEQEMHEARLARIRMSLERINELMEELRNVTRRANEEERRKEEETRGGKN